MHQIRLWILPISVILLFAALYITLSLPSLYKNTRDTLERDGPIINGGNEFVLRGNRIFRTYYDDALDALTRENNKPIWTFTTDDFIRDFTVTDKYVYVLTEKKLFILNMEGNVEKQISLQNLTGGKNITWHMMAWCYENKAYVYVHEYVYVFNGTMLDYKASLSIPELWFDKVPFGDDILLVHSNSTSRIFYDVHGSTIMWNLTTNPTRYYTNYPYLVTYNPSYVTTYKDGKLLWKKTFDMHVIGVSRSPKGIVIGMYGPGLWSHNVTIKIYGDDGNCERNFTLNLSSCIINHYTEILFTFNSEEMYMLLYGSGIYQFHIPANGTIIKPNDYNITVLGKPVSISCNGKQMKIISIIGDKYIIEYYSTHSHPAGMVDFSYDRKAKTGLILVFAIIAIIALMHYLIAMLYSKKIK